MDEFKRISLLGKLELSYVCRLAERQNQHYFLLFHEVLDKKKKKRLVDIYSQTHLVARFK